MKILTSSARPPHFFVTITVPSLLLLSIIPAALFLYLSEPLNLESILSPLPCLSFSLTHLPLFFFLCFQPTFAQFPPSPCWPTAPKEVIVKLGSDWNGMKISFLVWQKFFDVLPDTTLSIYPWLEPALLAFVWTKNKALSIFNYK